MNAGSWGAKPDAKYGWLWWATFGGTTLNGTRTTREDALADAQSAYAQIQDLRRRETLRSVTTSATKQQQGGA